MSEQRLQKLLKFRLAQNLQRWRKETAMLVQGNQQTVFTKETCHRTSLAIWHLCLCLYGWACWKDKQSRLQGFSCANAIRNDTVEILNSMCKKQNADTWSIFNWQSLVYNTCILGFNEFDPLNYINFMLTRCTLIHLPLPLKEATSSTSILYSI